MIETWVNRNKNRRSWEFLVDPVWCPSHFWMFFEQRGKLDVIKPQFTGGFAAGKKQQVTQVVIQVVTQVDDFKSHVKFMSTPEAKEVMTWTVPKRKKKWSSSCFRKRHLSNLTSEKCYIVLLASEQRLCGFRPTVLNAQNQKTSIALPAPASNIDIFVQQPEVIKKADFCW